jgi:hypothetical protein
MDLNLRKGCDYLWLPSPLIFIRKTPEEGTSNQDKLGMNAAKCNQNPRAMPCTIDIYAFKTTRRLSDYRRYVDYESILQIIQERYKAYSIARMDWSPSSPDLNPIENV